MMDLFSLIKGEKIVRKSSSEMSGFLPITILSGFKKSFTAEPSLKNSGHIEILIFFDESIIADNSSHVPGGTVDLIIRNAFFVFSEIEKMDL